MNRSSLWALVVASSLGLVLALGGCGKVSSEPALGGETHWLRNCAEGEACGAGLECLCGVCTIACTDDASCDRVGAGASCTPGSVSSHASSCDLQAPDLVCLSVADELASDLDSPFGWLQTCGVPGDPECGAGLECLCGVCTIACSDDASCSAWGGDGFCAERATSRRASICDSSAPERVCLSATDEASSFSIVEGNRYDERGCFQDTRIAGTTTGACEPVEMFAFSPNDGRCWRFPNGCVPNGFMKLSPAVRSQEACTSVTDLCPDSLICNDTHVATVAGCLTCDQTWRELYQRRTEIASRASPCSSDQDCVLDNTPSGCNDGCGAAVHRDDVTSYQSEVARLGSAYCSDSKWETQCAQIRPQCPAQGAFCRSGQCTIAGSPIPCSQRNPDNCEADGACRLARAQFFSTDGQCFADPSVAVGCLELEQSCRPVTTPALDSSGACYLFGDCLPAGFERAPEGHACAAALGTSCAP